MAKIVALWGAGLLLLVTAAIAAAVWYSLALPGKSFSGPLPPPTPAEEALAERLRRHVVAIASTPHNVAYYQELEQAAAYIEAELKALGYEPGSQVFTARGREVRNIEVVLSPPDAGADTESIVVGAHYDSAGYAPGANDNATGVAAVIELARLLKDVRPQDKRLRLVLFVNEEPPFDRTPEMGSWRYAQALKERGEKVAGMISLETLGSFSNEPGSQTYPPPFGLVFPSTANFVALVALPGSRQFLHRLAERFRAHTEIPTIGGTAPDEIDGIGWSDHWSFWKLGYPAVMITDTALFRYPHYHKASDTPDKIDYAMLARITLGLEQTLRDLLKAPN